MDVSGTCDAGAGVTGARETGAEVLDAAGMVRVEGFSCSRVLGVRITGEGVTRAIVGRTEVKVAGVPGA